MSADVSSIINQTTEATATEELFPSDIVDVIYILDKTKEKTKTQTDIENFIKSSSNIVAKEKGPAWNQVKVSIYRQY